MLAQLIVVVSLPCSITEEPLFSTKPLCLVVEGPFFFTILVEVRSFSASLWTPCDLSFSFLNSSCVAMQSINCRLRYMWQSRKVVVILEHNPQDTLASVFPIVSPNASRLCFSMEFPCMSVWYRSGGCVGGIVRVLFGWGIVCRGAVCRFVWLMVSIVLMWWLIVCDRRVWVSSENGCCPVPTVACPRGALLILASPVLCGAGLRRCSRNNVGIV